MRTLQFITAFLPILVITSPAHADILGDPVTNAANGRVYFLLTQNTWTASEAEARSYGGHLVTINDAVENQWVLDHFSNYAGKTRVLWIGLNDLRQSGAWEWTSGESFAYSNWATGEPNFIGQEHYVYIYSTVPDRPPGKWNNDYDRTNLGEGLPLHGVVEIDPVPIITTQPNSQNVVNGSSVMFTASALSGLGPLSYQWQKDGVNILGATSDKFTIPSATAADAGTYRVVISNAVGSVTSQSAVLALSATGFTTLTVTRTNTTGPGSLPVIINQANSTVGRVVIEFAASGTITVVDPLPTIANDVTVNGRTDSPVVIGGGGNVPIFTFAQGTECVLNRLTLTDGKASGGGAAINNAGTLFITDCVITNHSAPNGSGGAIRNTGKLTILSATLSGNKALLGGAVYNEGTLSISASRLSNNEAGNGGAIYNSGTIQIDTLSIADNRATLGVGGAVYNSGSLFANASTFSNNRATGTPGTNGEKNGRVTQVFVGTVPLYRFSGGGGGGGGGRALGGGLFMASGAASLTNCTFSANSCAGERGGNGGSGSSSGINSVVGGNGGKGGGMGGGTGGNAASNGNGGNGAGATITGSGGGGGGGGAPGNTLGGQGGGPAFGGGGGGRGGSGLSQTLDTKGPTAGQSGYGGNGGNGFGGGICIQDGNLVLVNCTITSNSATGGDGGIPKGTEAFLGGQPGKGVGGGVYNLTGSAKLVNVLVASNTAADSSPDLAGAFVSSGFNLIGVSQGATGLRVDDFQNVSANLSLLQDNGGPTLTHALQQGSLAIGGGTSAGAPATDQRGVFRPTNRVDIGAFQIGTVISPAIIWAKPADIVYGTPLGTVQLNATVGVEGTLVYNPAAVERSFVLGTLPLPVITTHPSNQTVNPGDRVTFNVSATNGPLSFQWRFNGAAIPGANSSALVLARVNADQAGPYDVILSNPSGSVTSKVAVLAVNISPGTPNISAQPQNLSVRVGENVTLSVSATGTLPLVYQWYQGASGDVSLPVPGATNSTFAVPFTTTQTRYWVSVRNSLGVVDSDTALVSVFPANAAKLGLRMISGLPALNIDGVVGTAYRIEYSTNLSAPSWTKLIELPLSSSPFVYIDPGAAGSTLRFYRVLVP